MFGFLLQNGIAKNFFQERFVLATANFYLRAIRSTPADWQGCHKKTSVAVSLPICRRLVTRLADLGTLGVVTCLRHRSRRTLERSTPSFDGIRSTPADWLLAIFNLAAYANLQIFPDGDLTSSCRFGAEFPQHVFNCHLFKDFKTICGTKTCPNVDLKTHIKLMYSNVLSHIKPH